MAAYKRFDHSTRSLPQKSRPAWLQVNFIVPVIILGLVVIRPIFCAFAGTLQPHHQRVNQNKSSTIFSKGRQHGTYPRNGKILCCDILSRCIYGARISLSVSLLVIAITASIGTALGIFSGYTGRAMLGYGHYARPTLAWRSRPY